MNMQAVLCSLSFWLFSLGLGLAQTELPIFDYTNYALHKEFLDNSKTEKDPWSSKEHNCPGEIPEAIAAVFKDVTKHSQSHLLAMYKGNMRLAMFSLAFPEKQYFKASGLDEKNFMAVTSCMGGFRPAFELLATDDVDYFSKLTEYLRFVGKIEEKPYYYMGRKLSFQLLRKAEDVNTIFNSPTIVGGGIQVFGGHLLGSYFYLRENLINEPSYETEVLKNARRLKGALPLVDHTEEYLDFPILFFTIDSDFRNGLGGDIPEEAKERDRKLYKEAIPASEELTAVGKKVVKLMVDKKQGRRICVDYRGLSHEARKWAYEYYQNLRYHGDTIPVVMVNTAVSGESWKREQDDETVARYFDNPPYHATREDLQAILASKGMLGISLNKRKLTANTEFAEILAQKMEGSADYRKAAVKILLAHVFRCVQVTQDRAIWDHLSISTGFDGTGSYFESYKTAEDLTDLRSDVLSFLQSPEAISDLYSEAEIKAFLYDYTPETIVAKLFSTNASAFTQSVLLSLEQDEAVEAGTEK